MTRHLSLISLLIFLSSFAMAKGDYTTWWQKANNYYQQKNYDSAAVYYKQLAKLEPRNAEVYYNLGNTYYRLNDVGNAVLNYEKALHLQPSHTQAADNLYLTQNRINNRIQQMPEIFFVQWWKSMTQARLANIYAVIALLLFILVMAYNIARKMGRINISLPAQATIATLVVCFVLVVLGMVAGGRQANPGLAVIMAEGTPMMAEPKYGKSVSLIPEGTTVEMNDTKADWCEITLPDGRTGWVQHSTLSEI